MFISRHDLLLQYYPVSLSFWQVSFHPVMIESTKETAGKPDTRSGVLRQVPKTRLRIKFSADAQVILQMESVRDSSPTEP
jgi:hypothetical protein